MKDSRCVAQSKGITLNWYSPKGVVNAVFSRSCCSTSTCQWRSEATPTGELGGQEKPDWLGGQQLDERGSDEEVQSRKSLSRVCVCSVLSVY
ncbi:hypothetical protein T05_7457 [Trichinella murrelli]|uniref:Uncharacterized protein n=1 Tax=Trichinella murrelli TaxID=144512 RepID=A0A0V0TCF3_9BILA|nr:hypothetical protein T05_7457 [Trichinella murrelli]